MSFPSQSFVPFGTLRSNFPFFSFGGMSTGVSSGEEPVRCEMRGARDASGRRIVVVVGARRKRRRLIDGVG